MSDILDTIDELDDEFEDDEDYALEGEIVEFDAGIDLEDYEMNERQAQEITEAIKSAATATFILISEAHKHKAHKALGYSTWAEYVNSEFDMSASRSYQLLDFSKTIDLIEASTPEGTEIKLTESQARDIKRELPRITEQIEEETRDMTPEDAATRAQELIEEQRNEIKEQKKADDKAVAEKQKAIDEANEEGYRAGLEAAADSLLESDQPDNLTDGADDGILEIDVEGDASMSPEDSMNLYNFFNMLTSISGLPDPEEFVSIVPDGRRDEIENQLEEAVEWLNGFKAVWDENNS